jgi:hypothetical protein
VCSSQEILDGFSKVEFYFVYTYKGNAFLHFLILIIFGQAFLMVDCCNYVCMNFCNYLR